MEQLYYVVIFDEKDVKHWKTDKSVPIPQILEEMAIFKDPFKQPRMRASPEDLKYDVFIFRF